MNPSLFEGFPSHLLFRQEVREGGMSVVARAFDSRRQTDVAVKIVHLGADEIRGRDSFMREAQALAELPHTHVVDLIEVDRLPDGRTYLLLEWIEQNLEERVVQYGPFQWQEFFHEIGRPVLTALVYMQERGWVHRDIKPKNILVNRDGYPKIADYGIAKQLGGPLRQGTLRGFRSAPYSAPEEDTDTRWSYGRDCFSFAATALFGLSGRSFSNYGEFDEELKKFGPDVPTDILRKALSSSPSDRQPNASTLLAELDAFEERMLRERSERYIQIYHCAMGPELTGRLTRFLGLQTSRELEDFLQADLVDAIGFEQLRPEDRRHSIDGPAVEVRVLGSRWALNAGWSGTGVPRLSVYNAYQISPAELGRRREYAFRPNARLSFAFPNNPTLARASLEALRLGLEEHEMAARFAASEAHRDRIFRMWYGFLKEKAAFEAQKEDPIRFVAKRELKEHHVLTAEFPVTPSIIGQARVIRLAIGIHIYCEISDAHTNDITIRITSGDEKRLPQRGVLAIDIRAAQRALERQRAALDAVFYNRAVSPRLKDLLADPSCARPPNPLDRQITIADDFDTEKVSVLQSALGLNDVLAVQGPPGTGKTRLIAEIITQYLVGSPKARILLASQTHAALDNVIERLNISRFDVVRVGKLDDKKIAKHSLPLLIDRKAEAWLRQVQARAELHMTQWAAERGLPRDQIEIGMLAERLTRILDELEDAKKVARTAAVEEEGIQGRIDDALAVDGAGTDQLDRDAGDTQRERTEAEQRVQQLLREEQTVRDRLRAKGGYGADLADSGRSDLAEWSDVLIPDEPTARQCKKLLEILEDWILRVGRSSDFQAAILAGSNVIAGTCIGVASVRGMSDVAFDLCIVDEASKATATETLVPMVRARKWILVGDPKQLPPYVEEGVEHDFSEFAEEEIRETIFSRLLKRLPEHSTAILRNQYRMVAGIGDLISECFYKDEGGLNSPVTTARVRLTGIFSKAVTWLDTSPRDDRRHTPIGLSLENVCEGKIVRRTLERIDYIARRRKATYDVAVIAGYTAQVALIETMIRDRYEQWQNITVECNTVDAFQGRQAEICIYSATRSHANLRLGFLREQPRLNVALSRARSALIVIGDAAFFRAAKGQNPFAPVLTYIENNPSSCEVRTADVS